MALLDVKNLRVRFETHHGTVNAVDGVSFHLEEGETLGLVGESGSGKSVTNLALMGLIPSPPGVVTAESVRFGNKDLLKLSDVELRKIRGNEIAMIFQDPMTSLNPLLTIDRQLTEVLQLHKGLSRAEARKLCVQGIGDVGIPNPESRLDSYPHELSGGMRQRVMIAMGLLCKPKLLIADEPTTALDVTIQAQILELMKDMQHKHGTAIVLVTHDLGVVAGMTDRINVMYAGKLAETGPCDELFARPLHPYTKGLLASVPTLLGDPNDELYSIPGSPPDLADLPKGCSFEPRCDLATADCKVQPPTLKTIQDSETGVNRRVACFEVSADTFDPNKELFQQLEQKEQESAASGALVWKAKQEETTKAEESAEIDMPGLMMPESHERGVEPEAESAAQEAEVEAVSAEVDSESEFEPEVEQPVAELEVEPEGEAEDEAIADPPLFPTLEEEPAGGPLAAFGGDEDSVADSGADSGADSDGDDGTDWKWIGDKPDDEEKTNS
jgi:oligopeptide transport system ATP-binding protein